MVHFVGAGPGAPDLITQRGAALLQGADCIIYAGSLVNPALLGLAKPGCAIYNSAEMTLEQVLDTMRRMEAVGKTTVRLHTGDPCLYGAIREQMDVLDTDGIPYDDHHPDGGPYPGAGKRKAAIPRRPRGHHGHLPVHRSGGKGTGGSAGRRGLHGRYPGGGGL